MQEKRGGEEEQVGEETEEEEPYMVFAAADMTVDAANNKSVPTAPEASSPSEEEKPSSWEVQVFHLHLMDSPDDRSAKKTNILDLAGDELKNGGKAGRRWWLQKKYTSLDGKSYNELVKYVKSVCPPSFKIQAQKDQRRNSVICKCSKWRSGCKFRFTLELANERFFLRFQNDTGKPVGSCFQHTCDPEITLRRYTPPSQLTEEDRKIIWQLFVKHQCTIQSTARVRGTFLRIDETLAYRLALQEKYRRQHPSVNKIPDLSFFEDPRNQTYSIGAFRNYMKNHLEDRNAVIYCPFNQEVYDKGQQFRQLLKEHGVMDDIGAERYLPSRPSDKEAHPYLKAYLYSGEAASRKVWNKPGDGRKITTLSDREPGYFLNGDIAFDVDADGDTRAKEFWHQMDEIGFPDVAACSYHLGEKPLSEEMTYYLGHCDAAHFAYVVFTLLHGVTWAVVAVPEGKIVPEHSNKEFDTFVETNLRENESSAKVVIDGIEQDETRAGIAKYFNTFMQDALYEMKKKDKSIERVELYKFMLTPGGYLSFNAYECFHGTITFKQGVDGFRELLALHSMIEQP